MQTRALQLPWHVRKTPKLQKWKKYITALSMLFSKHIANENYWKTICNNLSKVKPYFGSPTS